MRRLLLKGAVAMSLTWLLDRLPVPLGVWCRTFAWTEDTLKEIHDRTAGEPRGHLANSSHSDKGDRA